MLQDKLHSVTAPLARWGWFFYLSLTIPRSNVARTREIIEKRRKTTRKLYTMKCGLSKIKKAHKNKRYGELYRIFLELKEGFMVWPLIIYFPFSELY